MQSEIERERTHRRTSVDHDSERIPIAGPLWTPHEREPIVVCGRESERESQSEREVVRKREGERTHRQSVVDTTPAEHDREERAREWESESERQGVTMKDRE